MNLQNSEESVGIIVLPPYKFETTNKKQLLKIKSTPWSVDFATYPPPKMTVNISKNDLKKSGLYAYAKHNIKKLPDIGKEPGVRIKKSRKRSIIKLDKLEKSPRLRKKIKTRRGGKSYKKRRRNNMGYTKKV